MVVMQSFVVRSNCKFKNASFLRLLFYSLFELLFIFMLGRYSASYMSFTFVFLKDLFYAFEKLIFGRRSVRSLCTVDLLMPNSFAAQRTVALCAATYSPSSTHRSFSDPFIVHTPLNFSVVIYMLLLTSLLLDVLSDFTK